MSYYCNISVSPVIWWLRSATRLVRLCKNQEYLHDEASYKAIYSAKHDIQATACTP